MDKPRIIEQTADEIVLIKPAGMPTQADETGDLDLLSWTKRYLGEPLHLVHRIDRPVGGIVIFARNKKSAARWSERFRQGKVQKVYLAITQPPIYPPFGELRHFIKKDARRHRAQIFYRPTADAQLAVLKYQTLAVHKEMSLVLVEPQTGRFHQIRAQFAELGSPIVGDVKYGFPLPAPDSRSIALWAWKLERWTAPPPLEAEPWQAFAEAVKQLISSSSR